MIHSLLLFVVGMMLFYYIFQFVRVLWNLKRDIIFPVTDEDLASLWVQPQKPVGKPTYQGQKNGIIFYSLYLLFITGMCYLIWRFHPAPMAITYLLVLFPLLYSSNFLNLFMATDKGLIGGLRLIRWEKMRVYDVIKIDVNHKYYGHSPEINNQYEVKIHSRILSYSCIVTSKETRNKFVGLLKEKGVKERVNDLKNTVDSKEEFNHST